MAEINPFEIAPYLEEARSRVTEQFKDKEIFDRYLQLLLSGMVDIQEVFRQLMQLRSIDTATGAQLDIIGEIVGQPRELIDTDLLTFFAFQGYPEAQSYGDLNSPSTGGYYYDIRNPLAGNTLLTDEQYRLFIKAKIIKNNTSATPNQVIDFVKFVFGVELSLVVGEGNAEFTLMLGKELSSFERVLLSYISNSSGYSSNFIPKPIGVKMNFGQFNSANYFGFQGAPNAKGYGDLSSIATEGGYGESYGISYGGVTSVVIGGGKYASLI